MEKSDTRKRSSAEQDLMGRNLLLLCFCIVFGISRFNTFGVYVKGSKKTDFDLLNSCQMITPLGKGRKQTSVDSPI